LSWSRPFDDPIPLPNGRELWTLRDDGHYVAALPKTMQTSPRVAIGGGDVVERGRAWRHRYVGGDRNAAKKYRIVK
jgi:hypothetical protein